MNEEMTKIEADAILERIAEYEREIKAAEDERDTFKAHYQEKIIRAEDICEKETREAREQIALLTEKLRGFALANISEKKRSVPLPSGTLFFKKQPPKFYFTDDRREVSGKDARLVEIVKKSAPELLKVTTTETADWATLKKRLAVEGGGVYLKETGEVIEGVQCEILPDKFTVKTN